MTAVVKLPEAPPPIDYVTHAIQQGVSPEVLSKLIDNAARIDAIKARKAFDAAIAEARKEMPIIHKANSVSFGNGKAAYKFEDLATIARLIDPVLAKHGLSYRFRTSSNGMVTVTCVISHADGHSEENSLTAEADKSGNKNSIQAIGSAVTYLSRYTLKAALGLAASADDDAQSVSRPEMIVSEAIMADQVQAIEDLLKKKGRTHEAFLNWVQKSCPDVVTLKDIPVAYYNSCIQNLGMLPDMKVKP